MKSVQLYLILVVALWGILLKPTVQLENKLQLVMKIENVWSALLLANFYSLPVALAPKLSALIVKRGCLYMRYNYSWIFMMPYMLHCLLSFASLLDKLLSMLGPKLLEAENFGLTFLNLGMMLAIQAFAIVEMGTLLFQQMQQLCARGERLY